MASSIMTALDTTAHQHKLLCRAAESANQTLIQPPVVSGAHLNGMAVRIVQGEGALQFCTALSNGQGGAQIQQVGFDVHVWGVAVSCAADLGVGCAICDIQQHLVIVVPICVTRREDHLHPSKCP